MGAVRADRKLKLEQKLGRVFALGVIRSPQLTANLTELTREIGDDEGPPRVVQIRIRQQIRSIEAQASEPATSQLIVAGQVPSAGTLETIRLIAPADNELAAAEE